MKKFRNRRGGVLKNFQISRNILWSSHRRHLCIERKGSQVSWLENSFNNARPQVSSLHSKSSLSVVDRFLETGTLSETMHNLKPILP